MTSNSILNDNIIKIKIEYILRLFKSFNLFSFPKFIIIWYFTLIKCVIYNYKNSHQ